ncbi:isocitrate lyase/PEP mutase family protein [Streptomyces sp. LP05-1]|uniref:Isocitrate lyase/PEP mutase family protein n=1 Tax=Streptomyces pyxinae TaxID=2970734 RepID=A0ABT2CLV5_9ACTN|nr:isocitrate lyase/PEP mutase family protein [Streptomyces sp. LP05-1]MCS0638392.1 isocitrate lyase/PEP mutase family protein [Streptomyces sp. LP05-1]
MNASTTPSPATGGGPATVRAAPAGRPGAALRSAAAAPGTTPLIGVYDMYSATLAARHYDGLFVSGFGFAASYYGLPDIGFIAWPDMVDFTERLRGALPRHHLLVDIDDGYVDHEVACHVVRRLERIGASGVVMEDQSRPRRCGHLEGKQVLALDDYLRKLDAVLSARTDLAVVARTDATDEADILRRVTAFAATGADAVLVDGVRSTDLMRAVRAAAGDKPLVFNQIAGGKSPRLSLTELTALGVDLAIYSTPCLFAAHRAIDAALNGLAAADGLLPAADGEEHIGVADTTALLTGNIDRAAAATR